MLIPSADNPKHLQNLTTRWEETLLIDEAVERLVALDALVLFEVLQQPINVHR